MNETVNVTTEGLNETEVPPEEEKKEAEENEEPSPESQYIGDSYQSQLKNLQVSLRYEKVSILFEYSLNSMSTISWNMLPHNKHDSCLKNRFSFGWSKRRNYLFTLD